MDQQSKDAAIGSIVKQVAHDIRSPLAALSVIEKDLKELPEEKRILVRRALGRIHDIANDLLEKGRDAQKELMQSQDSVLFADQKPPTHLISALLESIITEKRLQYRSLIDIEIERQFDQQSYGLFAQFHAAEFKRVISNIINNAIEAIEQKGRVIVTLHGDSSNAEIAICDTGKGIPATLLTSLMQRGITHGKADGSGLGLYYAGVSLESWGGTLLIESQEDCGTTVKVRIPRAAAPAWFVPELILDPAGALVILDDDVSIHQVWQSRLDTIQLQNQKPYHLSTPEDLRHWVQTHRSTLEQTTYLIDYEFLGHTETGLDLIETLDIAKQSILITSRFDEPAVRAQCEYLGVKLVPKGLAGFVPIHFVASSYYDAILLDDDEMIHIVWKMAARKYKKNFLSFYHPADLLEKAATLCRTTPLFIDAKLSDGAQGETIAKELYGLGFREIYLATGYAPKAYANLPWIKGIVGKEPPWTV